MEKARLFQENAQIADAIDALQRAQNISHRNFGVHSINQLKMVNLLTQLAITNSEYDDADVQQRFAFFVTLHNLDNSRPDIIAAYVNLADWYLRSGQAGRARRLIDDALVLTDSMAPDEPGLASRKIQLSMLAEESRRLKGLCCKARELEKAIAELEHEHLDSDSLSAAYLTLADTQIIARKSEEAAILYLKAAELNPLVATSAAKPITVLRELDDPRQPRIQTYRVRNDPFTPRDRLEKMTAQEQMEDLFREPRWFILDGDDNHLGFKYPDLNETWSQDRRTQILVGDPIKFSLDQLENILPLSLKSNEARGQLLIKLTFDITIEGDLENISVFESNAPYKLERLLVAALKRVYFRPQLINGVPVPTQGVLLNQTFVAEQNLLSAG